MSRIVLLLVVLLGAAVPAFADIAPEKVAAAQADEDAPTNTFQSRHKENLDHEPYVVAAYMVIWAGLFLYLRSLRTRQGKLDADIASLKDALARYDSDKRKAS